MRKNTTFVPFSQGCHPIHLDIIVANATTKILLITSGKLICLRSYMSEKRLNVVAPDSAQGNPAQKRQRTFSKNAVDAALAEFQKLLTEAQKGKTRTKLGLWARELRSTDVARHVGLTDQKNGKP